MGKLKKYMEQCSLDEAICIYNAYSDATNSDPPPCIIPLDDYSSMDPFNSFNTYCKKYNIQPMQIMDAVADSLDSINDFSRANYAFVNFARTSGNFDSPSYNSFLFPSEKQVRKWIVKVSDDIERYCDSIAKEYDASDVDVRSGLLMSLVKGALEAFEKMSARIH